ncbi:MAG: hypothetical protein E7665_08530 [Ruminococcaceae bacterium]|nr:hypothetical protein [Oscillospiraceae bacterium]
MKTHTLTLLIIVIILSFSSCTIPADTISLSKENVPYSTLYTDSSPLDFIIVGVTNNRLVDMYKIYLEEAVMLPLCPDPLCRHNSASCTFFDINPTIYLDKETGYFLRSTSEIGNFKQICRYNFYTDKLEILYEVEKGSCIHSIRPYEKYIFFLKESRGADKKSNFYMMRYDKDTGKVKQLAKEDTFNISILNSENDRFYFCLGDDIFYSTDENYENRRENDKNSPPRNITGDYHFITQNAGREEGRVLTSVTEIKRADGEDKVIIEKSATMPIFYNGNIIYTIPEKRYPIGYIEVSGKDDPEPIYEYCGGKYYICAPDGSNKRLLLDISGENAVVPPGSPTFGDILGSGDYIILKLKDYKVLKESDEKDRKIMEPAGDKYISVNIKTGEYKTVSMG